jgi:crotonobetainyl-CoA:carnitine CoA-transferase CaiB-like acyl-CoA transferase
LKHKRADLLVALKEAGIPGGEVLGLLEALSSRRAAGSGMVVQRPAQDGGARHVLAPPYRLDGKRMPVRRMPPTLAQDSAAILSEDLACPAEEQKRLAKAAIVR